MTGLSPPKPRRGTVVMSLSSVRGTPTSRRKFASLLKELVGSGEVPTSLLPTLSGGSEHAKKNPIKSAMPDKKPKRPIYISKFFV